MNWSTNNLIIVAKVVRRYQGGDFLQTLCAKHDGEMGTCNHGDC